MATTFRLDRVSFIFVFIICGIIGITVICMALCVVFPLEKIRDCCLRTLFKEKGKLIFQSRRRLAQVEPEQDDKDSTRNAYFRNDECIAEVL